MQTLVAVSRLLGKTSFSSWDGLFASFSERGYSVIASIELVCGVTWASEVL